MSFVPRQLTPAEIASFQKEFLALSKDPTKMEFAWKEMDSFFRTASIRDDVQYWNTFFGWYTSLSWKMLNAFQNEFILGVVAPRQIVKAILLGYDVFSDLTWYLMSRTKDAQDMMSFYSKLKQNIFTSPAIVGQFQGKDVTMAEIIKEIDDLNKSGNDSLKSAEFLTKLKKILYKQEDEDNGYIMASADEVVDRFFNLIHFFMGVEPKRVYYVIDAMFHPEKYENAPVAPENTEDVLDALEKETTEVSPVEPEPIEPVEPQETDGITYEEIKNMIDGQFPKDETGQYLNIEGVFEMLEQLSEEYNDESIKELLYFDENSGGFIWQQPS